MSKICANCGSQLDDDAVFCGNCGTPVQNNTSTGSNESKGGIAGAINKFIDNVKKKDGKSIGILAGAGGVLVLLIVLIIVLSVSGSSPDKALDNYIDVLLNGEVNKMEKIAPDEYWDYAKENEDMTMSKLKSQYKDLYEEYILDALEETYGDDVRIKARITDKDTVRSSVFNDMKDYLKSQYSIPKKSVEEAVKMDVTFLQGR